MRPKLVVADLRAFKAAARRFGAAQIETTNYDEEEVSAGRQRAPDFGFRWRASADSGGCGSPGCHCSPGLWVSASQGNERAVAHFGEDFERGGQGFFARKDYQNWLKLQRALKQDQYNQP